MSAKTAFAALVAAIVLPLLFSGTALACVVCFPSCGDVQCGRVGCQQCNLACLCAGPVKAGYLQIPHPGIFTSQLSSHSVVTTVIPGSPADKVGISVGDEVISIENPNAKRAGLCGGETWGDGSDRGRIYMNLKRGDAKLRVAVALRPLGELISVDNPALRNVSSREPGNRFARGPFTYGLNFSQRRHELLVTDVIPGSPADAAGLQAGDEVFAMDGVAIMDVPSSGLRELVAPAYRKTVRLSLRRHGSTLDVRLKAEGMSQLVRRLGQSEGRSLVASR